MYILHLIFDLEFERESGATKPYPVMNADSDRKQWFGGYAFQGGEEYNNTKSHQIQLHAFPPPELFILQDTWKGNSERSTVRYTATQ